MRYVFLERMDISILEMEYLHLNYSKYCSNFEIDLYKLFVEQSNELNYIYNEQNILNKITINRDNLQNVLTKLMDLGLIEIYKDSVYIIKLNKVKINSEFYNLEFVSENSFINYSTYQKFVVKEKESLNFDLGLFNTLLGKQNIVLNDQDIKKIANFKKLNPINDAKLLELVKKSYNNIEKQVDIGKLTFLFKDDFVVTNTLSGSLLSWIEQSSNKLYANKDKDVFVRLLNKHENLTNEQIKAIITYVYKTQKNVYYNFVDKLAISLQREKITDYEQCLKLLNGFESKKVVNFKANTNKNTNEVKSNSSKLEFEKLNRKPEKGVAVSIQDLLKQNNGK